MLKLKSACPPGYSENATSCISPLDGFMVDLSFNKISNCINDSLKTEFCSGSSNNFYPNTDQNDPVPSSNRGYYFRSNSYTTSNPLILSISKSIGFYIRQISPGILLRKQNFTIYSNLTVQIGQKFISFTPPDNDKWVHIKIIIRIVEDNSYFW